VGHLVSREDIGRAVAILRAGGLVAFPTETVYGLGADARNPEAIRRLFAAKGRPADHPVIVHLADASMVREWAWDVPPAAEQLAAAFWPGPLTLILPRAPHVLDLVTGGQDSVGLRVPSHPVAHDLLAAFGDGIVAPSANRFGRISPTKAGHVHMNFDWETVPLVLNGGRTEVGLESTIVDLTSPHATLLRPGGITPQQLAEVLGELPAMPTPSSPRASGTLPKHYAPRTPVELVSPDALPDRAAALRREGLRVVMLLRSIPLSAIKAAIGSSSPLGEDYSILPGDAAGYAHALYSSLHLLDWKGADRILIEDVPEGDEWLAVRDRLRRAAA
jgi:L-threonylcarbamoyladenylate synthase